MDNIVFFLLYVSSVVVASFSQLLLKKSANATHENLIKEYLNKYVIGGYSMLVVSMLLTILAYRGLDYKHGPIIESLGYVLVMILSRLFLNEKLTRRKIVGTGMILLGIVVFYI